MPRVSEDGAISAVRLEPLAIINCTNGDNVKCVLVCCSNSRSLSEPLSRVSAWDHGHR